MPFISDNNPFLIQQIPVFNTVDPTGGVSAITSLQESLNGVLGMVDTTNHIIKTNSIATYDSGVVVFPGSVEFQGEVTGLTSNMSGLSLSTTTVYLSTSVASVFINGVAGGGTSTAITLGPSGIPALNILQNGNICFSSSISTIFSGNTFIYGSTFTNYVSSGRTSIGDTLRASSTFTNYVSTGRISVGENLDVSGSERIQGNLVIGGNGYIQGNLDVSGSGVFTGDVTCQTLYQTSDKRLKTNITPIYQPLSTLKGIRGVHFTWKNNGEQDIGFLAQEIDKVLPFAVAKPVSVEVDGDTTDDYWRVSYIKVVPLLVEAVKKLEDRVVELEGQMDVVYRYNRLSKG